MRIALAALALLGYLQAIAAQPASIPAQGMYVQQLAVPALTSVTYLNLPVADKLLLAGDVFPFALVIAH